MNLALICVLPACSASFDLVQQLERQITLAQEKLARQVQSGEEMRQQAKEQMDKLKDEYAHKAKDRTSTLKQVERRRADKKVVEDEMKKFRDEHKKQLDGLLAEYTSVREAMGELFGMSCRFIECQLNRLDHCYLCR